MPSLKYINQSAPFWDFVANLENEGVNHPMFGGNGQARESEGEENNYGWGPWGRGSLAHRPHPQHGPHSHHGPHHRGPHGHGRRGGPPPPPGEDEDVPPPPFEEKEGSSATMQGEKGEPSGKSPERDGHSDGEGRRGRHGPGGFGRRGHCGGKRGGPNAWGHGGQGGHGGHGPWGRRGFPFGGLASGFWNQNQETENGDFKPDVDVFDTESAYVVHLSLPGAKKEDISVSWDAEKSEVAIAGVVHRPGDEEFLRTLAMDERKVGAFERKVRLGSLANPAQVDVEAISAKLEDGILRVEIPKQDKDYVEVKMVDIE